MEPVMSRNQFLLRFFAGEAVLIVLAGALILGA